MNRTRTLIGAGVVAGVAAVVGLTAIAVRAPAHAAASAAEPTAGKIKLMSAGAMTFGPAGVLFVGDSIGGAVVAIQTEDSKPAAGPVKVNVDGIDVKIAAIAGVTPDQIVINDMRVNPVSKNVYVSASRGRGPDAMPMILRIDATGNITPLALDRLKLTSVSLVDAPADAVPADPKPEQRGNPRMQTITDMNFVDGRLMVAGLSNEEWSSALRSIPYPFKTAQQGATLQIWHSSHGRFETAAPVRRFVPYTIDGKAYVLAAYTCTPLVKIPVSDLKPGAQVKGVEIADLGAGNQPLDMVPYKKDGHDYILIANTSYGVVKLKADKLETYPEIAAPTRTGVAGVPYDKIGNLTNVTHLAQLDNSDVMIMSGKTGVGGGVGLSTVALP